MALSYMWSSRILSRLLWSVTVSLSFFLDDLDIYEEDSSGTLWNECSSSRLSDAFFHLVRLGFGEECYRTEVPFLLQTIKITSQGKFISMTWWRYCLPIFPILKLLFAPSHTLFFGSESPSTVHTQWERGRFSVFEKIYSEMLVQLSSSKHKQQEPSFQSLFPIMMVEFIGHFFIYSLLLKRDSLIQEWR